ncbi:arginase family protein [Actinomadura sp. NPDC048955]|uniref:arginase family protein n=1 Tax=Actinomadura sp. NPDC048955 TaxID=3158228 RepID=UPI003402CB92
MREASGPVSPRQWLIIGAPMDGSGTDRGEASAPGALRNAGLVAHLSAVDFGDLPVAISDARRDPSVGIIGYQQLVHGTSVIADAVSSALHAGWRPFLIGGCCSILPGALAGMRRHNGPAKLVFVDGHLDLFTPSDTRTGELSGMALGAVTGYWPARLTPISGVTPLVEPADVLALGDADAPRRRVYGAAEAATAIPDAHVFDARAILSSGPALIAERAAAIIDQDDTLFWMHVDVDVLDGSLRPAVGYVVDGGIGWSELEILLRTFAHDPRLAGISLANLNVKCDHNGEFIDRLTSLLAAILT